MAPMRPSGEGGHHSEVALLLTNSNKLSREKWDGCLPQFTGGGTIPFIDLSHLEKK